MERFLLEDSIKSLLSTQLTPPKINIDNAAPFESKYATEAANMSHMVALKS